MVDNDGKLWLGTGGGGLANFDPKKETCFRLEHDPKDSLSLSNNSVSSINCGGEEKVRLNDVGI